MAVTLGDAVVYITGDSSALQGSLQSAEKMTTSWATGLGGSVATLVGGAVVKGAVAATAAVVGIGAAAINVSTQLDMATDSLIAQTGATEEQALRLQEVIKKVYGDNFTGSIQEAGVAVGTVVNQLGEQIDRLTDEELTRMTEQAIALEETFGTPVQESIRGVSQVMRELGLTGDQAMALITTGFQNGLNRSDDWIDTLNEYASDFEDLGANADDVLNIINNGLEAGFFNTDKIADAMREFKINLFDAGRINTIASELTPQMVELIEKAQEGKITGVQAMAALNAELAKMEDPVKRQTIGVGLYGSMWEDSGAEAILALTQTNNLIEFNSESLDKLMQRYDNFPSMLEGLRRRAILSLEPIGDKLLEIANDFMPTVEKAFSWIETRLPEIIGRASGAFDRLIAVAGGLFDLFAKGDFTGQLGDALGVQEDSPLIRTFFDIRNFIVDDFVPALVNAFENIKSFYETTLSPVFQSIGDLIRGTVMPALSDLGSAIIDQIIPAFAQATNGTDMGGFAANIKNIADFIIQDAVPALETWIPIIVDELIPGLVQLATWAGEIAAVALPILGDALAFVTRHLDVIVPVLAVVGGAILLLNSPILAVSALLVAFATAWANNWGGIQDIVANFLAWFDVTIAPTMERIFGIVQTVFDAFSAAFAGDWELFGSRLRAAWDDAWDLILQALINIGVDLVNSLSESKDRMVATIAETDWKQLGIDVILGILEGLQSAEDDLIASAIDSSQAFVDAWRGFWRSKSPSMLAMSLSEDVVAGFALPFANLGQRIVEAAGDVAGFVNEQITKPLLRESDQWLSQTGSGTGKGAGPRLSLAGAGGGPDVSFDDYLGGLSSMSGGAAPKPLPTDTARITRSGSSQKIDVHGDIVIQNERPMISDRDSGAAEQRLRKYLASKGR